MVGGELARRKWVYDRARGEIVEVDLDYRPPRKSVGPMVITDTHQPFQSMADGLWYDSKSAYRKSIKAKGLEEVGNEKTAFMKKEAKPMTPIRDTLEKAEAKLKAGYKVKPKAPPKEWNPSETVVYRSVAD